MSKRRLPRKDRKALGVRLKAAREAVALTQTQAARRLGLHITTTLSNYEQGRVEIPLALLAGMAELYRCRLEALLFGQPPAAVVDLETRRRYAQVQRRGQELMYDLAKLTRQLEALFAPANNNRKKRRAR
jgi:transcriptional regulator with XRE-family HTH domain